MTDRTDGADRGAADAARRVAPFLFLGIRAEDVAADDEYAAFLRSAGLTEAQLHRVRLEAGPLGDVDLEAYSGVLLGGGSFCVSDPTDTKSAVQLRVEADLDRLLKDVLAADVPFLGCCYGIGTLGRHIGAVVDRTYPEPVSGVQVRVTPDGAADPVFAATGPRFYAFTGHKEAVTTLPPEAVLLATGDGAPVQAFRVGRAYATQFHPELDLAGLELRMRTYAQYGYFAPEELDDLLAAAAVSGVDALPPVLRRFVEVYARRVA
ncbi:MAG: glutamine amidotransferase [Micrococcales bacterium]|nr:glutamine amidotransferase [Micrococcales bacterium]